MNPNFETVVFDLCKSTLTHEQIGCILRTIVSPAVPEVYDRVKDDDDYGQIMLGLELTGVVKINPAENEVTINFQNILPATANKEVA